MDVGTEARRPRSGSLVGTDHVSPVASRSILTALVVVAIARAPYVLGRGRFWAEEGTTYFATMHLDPGPTSLVFVPARTGYLNLFANITTWLAALVPLRLAPLVTAWLSLGVVVTVAWVAIAWPSDLLPDARSRVTAAVLLVVGTLALAEVWANSINAQTYLGILAVLMLFARVDELTRRRFVLAVAMMALAGLSGLYAAALAPLFVVAALGRHSSRRWILAAVTGAAAIVQSILFLRARAAGTLAESRATVPGVGEVVRSVGGLHLGGMVLGKAPVARLAEGIDERSPVAFLVVGIVVLGVAALLAALAWQARTSRVPAMLLGSLVIIEALALLGSLGRGAEGRYAVVPIALLTLMLVHGAASAPPGWLARAAAVTIAVVLISGVAQFWLTDAPLLRCQGCPDWAAEVDHWQSGGSNELAIWPYDTNPPWTVVLPRDGS